MRAATQSSPFAAAAGPGRELVELHLPAVDRLLRPLLEQGSLGAHHRVAWPRDGWGDRGQAGPGCPNEKPDKPKAQIASVDPCKDLADGTASSDFAVKKGPFGKDQVVCTAPPPCFISVDELAAGDVERSPDVFLTFK